MGKIAKKMLVDASDALVHDLQGLKVCFLAKGSTIQYVLQYQAYELTLPVYKRGKGSLVILFYVDALDTLIDSEVWENDSKQVLNKEEQSVLRDMYTQMLIEGDIPDELSTYV